MRLSWPAKASISVSGRFLLDTNIIIGLLNREPVRCSITLDEFERRFNQRVNPYLFREELIEKSRAAILTSFTCWQLSSPAISRLRRSAFCSNSNA
jgi:predicted nucleic acid-binding protein